VKNKLAAVAMLALAALLIFVARPAGADSLMQVSPGAAQVLPPKTTTGEGDVFYPNRVNSSSLWQVKITGMASVCLKGRIAGSDWVVLATRSSSGITVVPATPEMVVEVTSIAGTAQSWFANAQN